MDKPTDDVELDVRPERSQARRIVALLVIGTATAQGLRDRHEGSHAVRGRTTSPDGAPCGRSWRRGRMRSTPAPWQANTQDKVKKPDKLAVPKRDDSFLKHREYELAPASWKQGEATQRFYSSKPPLLPTMIAGVLYPVRKITGVPPRTRAAPAARGTQRPEVRPD